MSHLLDEQRLAFSELASREGISASTVWRWCLKGCRGITLESFAIGGRRYTTVEAFSRFVDQTTVAATGQAIRRRTAPQRAAAIRQAETELAAAGI